MGHYLSEMEGESAYQARHDRINRVNKIREALENIPLSAFMASDFKALSVLQGVSDNSGFGPNLNDIESIETRINEWKKGKSKKRKIGTQ